MSDMQHQQPAIARAVTSARAIVCAGGVDTPYLRAGRGEPIVIVVDDVDGDEVQPMIDTLAHNYLVIVASPPAAVAVGAWLAEFTEGLGLSDAHVLLHASRQLVDIAA